MWSLKKNDKECFVGRLNSDLFFTLSIEQSENMPVYSNDLPHTNINNIKC